MSEYIIDYELIPLKWRDGYGLSDIDLTEEIVRCRDCRYFRFVDRSDIFHDERHNDNFCLRFVGGKLMEVEPDGFCAWGERRTDE